MGWVAGFVFSNIIYTLTVSFGDIGKAIAVVLLVMQVAGSGGTFPIEMTADFFQGVYPFLPFTHAINAMHAAMAGAYGWSIGVNSVSWRATCFRRSRSVWYSAVP